MSPNSEQIVVADSRTQGKGLFAKRDFEKGEIILDWNPENQYLSEEELSKLPEEDKRFIATYQGKYLLIAEPERYMNHSCSPNTESREGIDYASRDIKVGEEITGDYQKEGTLVGFKCDCDSSGCRGVIAGRRL